MRHFTFLFVRLLVVGLLVSFALTSPAQSPEPTVVRPGEVEDKKLPNGKSQKSEIAKDDHKRNVTDSAELARLAEVVRDDLAKTDSGVVSVKMMKQLDDIEKLTKNIRNRLKRY
jgi:hypothetical protein